MKPKIVYGAKIYCAICKCELTYGELSLSDYDHLMTKSSDINLSHTQCRIRLVRENKLNSIL